MSVDKTSFSNPIRETLFGDMPLESWPSGHGTMTGSPWSEFESARSLLSQGDAAAARASWRQVLGQANLERRHYLQAWHFLRERGEQVPTAIAKQVLGVVLEVAMPQGLDLLAAYSDHTARYYNYSGAGVVWEHADDSLDPLIDALLDASAKIVALIGPWERQRPGPPPAGQTRVSFLTPSGIHFGQAPMETLSSDPMAGGVIHLATVLMQQLIAKSRTR